ncbi:MAG TPA: RodZ domain-containing protein [Terriglobales bacterium]|jgi:cytoskeleton protein RodZ|nr:RodZ domain-containing protein [Terriglobales bacterium]
MRREREMRGVSLEEISESTKIGTRSLRALEDEDFEKLPGGIFNKGFVRAYSRFLGLDEDQAVADFDAAWREQQAAKEPFPETLPESQQEAPEPSSRLPIAIIAIVLLAVFAGGYAVKYFLAARAESKQSVQPAAQQLESPSSLQAQSAAPQPSPVSERAVSSQEKTEPGQSKSQEATTAAPAKTPSTPVEGQKLAATDLPSASTSSAPILLEVIAHEDSWLSVSADGKSLGQGILNAQKSRTIRANKEVRLRVGNVAGVEVSFNGKPVNIDGEPKQVKELTFTPEGLRQ